MFMYCYQLSTSTPADIPLEAAQRALEAANRRRKLASKVAGCGDGADKRGRPTPTNSTKVTPEGKKPCDYDASGIAPRALSFSEACDEGELVKTTCAALNKTPLKSPPRLL